MKRLCGGKKVQSMTKAKVQQLLGTIPAIMVRVTNWYNSDMVSNPPTKNELYDMTRWAWTASLARAQKAQIIIGVARDAKTGIGRVVSVCQVKRCDLVSNILPPQTRPGDPVVAADISKNVRVAFEGQHATGALSSALVGNTVGAWFVNGRNHPRPFEYFNC